ncbi:MAG: hypothetical protein HKN39_06970 [Flavobacteriales bacterium]|nr:hypothetical protein [Flavobacteriales bacterium]
MPYVEARLDTNSILIGEQTNIKLSVHYSNENDLIEFPAITDTLHKSVEVIEVGPRDTLNSNDHFVQRSYITLTSFDSGYYAIKPFQFKVNDQTLESEALLIEVENVKIDSTNAVPFDIKDIYQDPLTFSEFMSEYGYKIIGGVGLLTMLTYLFWFLFARKSAEVIVHQKIEPQIPDYIIALERLEKLREEKLWQRGKHKAYHSELTEALRIYLESRFNVNAMEQTSDEIIHQMKYVHTNDECRSELIRILKLADMVKFAKEEPSAIENEKMMELALEFVKNTKRNEEISTENIALAT